MMEFGYSPAAHEGPVTAIGVDLLTKMYVIYMERNTSHRAIDVID